MSLLHSVTSQENSYSHLEFEEVKHIVKVKNASECGAMCCNLGDKCITWQYELYSKQCEFGPVMRLGTEAAGCGWLV